MMLRLFMSGLLAFGLAIGPAAAQGGFGGALTNEPENPPARPAPSSPAAAPQPAQPLFPALVGCETSLAGLAPDKKEATEALLRKRVDFWKAQAPASIEPFRHPMQAAGTLACFQRRFALLERFRPGDAAIKAAQAAGTAFQEQWGDKIDAMLAGAPSKLDDGIAWWTEADKAFGALVGVEIAFHDALGAAAREREQDLAPVRTALAEFALTIDQVKSFQDTLDEAGRAFWLRALAWRARGAGLALDALELADFAADPEGAYALLTRPVDAEPASPQRLVAGDLDGLLLRVQQLRRASGALDPGAPRDWSKLGERRRIAEELYLVNFMSQTMDRRIAAWQREEAETFKLRLRLTHDIEVARGLTEAESRALRDQEWLAFRNRQRQQRERALAEWKKTLGSQRQLGIITAAANPPK